MTERILNIHRYWFFSISQCLFCVFCVQLYAGFEIESVILSPQSYTEEQRALLDSNLERAESLWESVILGHEDSDDDVRFILSVQPVRRGLAAATTDAFQEVGEKIVATRGTMFINVDEIVNISVGGGINPGLNVLDELLAHEIGHALGIGTLWVPNSLYVDGSGEYTGQHALSAYQEEFDSAATFVPVELAGEPGSRNSHWNQLFRSSVQEGNPADPLSLSPLIGVTDARGRDFAQDLMSPAIDADYGEPFLSNTTVQAMRDLGFETVPSFPFIGDVDGNGFIEVEDINSLLELAAEQTENLIYDLNGDGIVSLADRSHLIRNIIGSDYGDANLDGLFDSRDLVEVFQAAEYRDGLDANSTWETGDWDGDREFDTSDFLLAFQTGSFEDAANAIAVPEPRISVLFIVFSASLLVQAIRLATLQSV